MVALEEFFSTKEAEKFFVLKVKPQRTIYVPVCNTYIAGKGKGDRERKVMRGAGLCGSERREEEEMEGREGEVSEW